MTAAAELHIASCILRTLPAHVAALSARIAAGTQVEVAAADPAGKLILLVEGASTGALLDQIDHIRTFPGVMSIELVYQHAEEAQAMKEPMP